MKYIKYNVFVIQTGGIFMKLRISENIKNLRKSYKNEVIVCAKTQKEEYLIFNAFRFMTVPG